MGSDDGEIITDARGPYGQDHSRSLFVGRVTVSIRLS